MKKWIFTLGFLLFFTLLGCTTQNTDDDDDNPNDTVTVYFNVYGGSFVDPIILEKGDTLTPPTEPLRTNYTFGGWYYDTDYLIPFNFDAPINSNTQAHAQWISNDNDETIVTISFNTNGGTSIDSLSGLVGDTFSLPTPTKTQHTFDGWFTSAALTTPFTDTVFPESNITLHAKWIDNTTTTETATISFNTNGGSSISPLTGTIGDALNLPEPTKANNTFDGWFTNSDLTQPFTDSIFPSTDITLYAKWLENTTTPDTTTITFDTNGGSSISPLTSSVGDALNLPEPTKADYTFDGWFTNSDLTQPFTDSTFPNTDTTLYAKWLENEPETITITFNVNGGSPITPVTIDVNTSYWPAPVPTRDGYDFLGWYTDASLTTQHTQNHTFTSNTTLYAKWQETVSNLTLFTATLENDYDFTCNSNTCIYYLASNIYYQYHIDTNSFSFTSITDNTEGSMYRQKEEIITIDENWDALYTYDLEEDYGIYYFTYFTYSGNVLTNIYSEQRFNSNYDTRAEMITDARNRITQLASFINALFDDANLTFDDLK